MYCACCVDQPSNAQTPQRNVMQDPARFSSTSFAFQEDGHHLAEQDCRTKQVSKVAIPREFFNPNSSTWTVQQEMPDLREAILAAKPQAFALISRISYPAANHWTKAIQI